MIAEIPAMDADLRCRISGAILMLLVAFVSSVPPTRPATYESQKIIGGVHNKLYRIKEFSANTDGVHPEDPALETLPERRPRSVDTQRDDLLATYGYTVTPEQPRDNGDPDCFVRECEWVKVGGRCKRVRSGVPFCLVDDTLYFRHPDCPA